MRTILRRAMRASGVASVERTLARAPTHRATRRAIYKAALRLARNKADRVLGASDLVIGYVMGAVRITLRAGLRVSGVGRPRRVGTRRRVAARPGPIRTISEMGIGFARTAKRTISRPVRRASSVREVRVHE